MSFTVPTLDETHEFLIAQFKALLAGADVSRLSFYWKFLRVLAAAGADNHAHIVAVKADLLPDTAEGAGLDRWGTVTGVERKLATAARKDNALRVTGTAAATVTTGDELTHESGQTFQINQDATIPAAGWIDVDVVSISTGSAARLNAGEQLTFVSTPVGIDEIAELQIDIDEDGDDQEQDGAYRLRILNRFNSPPLGGAQNDYQEWAKSMTGIASAYAYPNRAGLGSVDLAALHAGSGASRVLLAGEVTDLQAHIDELRPVSVKAFRVLNVIAEARNVEVSIRSTGEARFAWDWDDETPMVISTWVQATGTLTFTTDRPATMKAGDRIVNVSTSGVPMVIESLSGTDSVILEERPVVMAGTVYAGGELTEPVRDAIVDLFDSLGTANPDDIRYGDWDGDLRISSLYRATNSVEGVIDATIVSPVSNVEAADYPFPDDADIGLLIPGSILVRKEW